MKERSLVLVKHDGVLRGLVGEVVRRFENIGLKIIGMKMVWADQKLTENHYTITEEWANGLGEKTRKAMAERGLKMKETNMEIAERVQGFNRKFLREGPVVAIVLEGNHAIELIRKHTGNTETRQALPGTIRGDYGHDSYQAADQEKRTSRNLIHASSSTEEADREISLWFSKEDLHSYENQKDKGVH